MAGAAGGACEQAEASGDFTEVSLPTCACGENCWGMHCPRGESKGYWDEGGTGQGTCVAQVSPRGLGEVAWGGKGAAWGGWSWE